MANEFFVQKRPTSNSAETLYESLSLVHASYIYVTNLTNGIVRFSIYVAPQGESFNKSTALIYREQLGAYDTDLIGYSVPLLTGMKIGVWSSVSGSVNFTVFGGTSAFFF